jgi:hypothetical protein
VAIRLAESGAKVVLGWRDAERAIGIAEELRASWPELTLDIAGATGNRRLDDQDYREVIFRKER